MTSLPPLRTVRATRYVTPLREGGSLPGLVEADDDGLYVVKFRGAGQGPRSLVAELVAGGIGHAMGFPIPELVFVDFDLRIAAAEPDPEIQELLRRSAGLNVGMDFLPGALAFDTTSCDMVDPTFAAKVVWFDAALTNIDRTARNPNMIRWHGSNWLIDHGAALLRQHSPAPLTPRADAAFAGVAQHVLLQSAGCLADVQETLRRQITPQTVEEIVRRVPPGWLVDEDWPQSATQRAEDLAEYLGIRLFERDVAADVEEARNEQR